MGNIDTEIEQQRQKPEMNVDIWAEEECALAELIKVVSATAPVPLNWEGHRNAKLTR
jgi:hypothetical protein